MNGVDHAGRRQIPVDFRFDAEGNDVKPRCRDFLPANDDGSCTVTAEPIGEARSNRLVVIADRDDIEPPSTRLRAKIPTGQRAIARKRMDVKITGEYVVAACTRRCREDTTIADTSSDQSSC